MHLLEATRDACVAEGCSLGAALGTAVCASSDTFGGLAKPHTSWADKTTSKRYVIGTALATTQI